MMVAWPHLWFTAEAFSQSTMVGETRSSIYNIVNISKSRLKSSKMVESCSCCLTQQLDSVSEEAFCGVQATVSLSQHPEKAMLLLLFRAACQAGLMKNSLSQTELRWPIFNPSPLHSLNPVKNDITHKKKSGVGSYRRNTCRVHMMSLVMSEVFILVFWHTTTMDDGICCLVRVSAVHNALWDTLSVLYRAVIWTQL